MAGEGRIIGALAGQGAKLTGEAATKLVVRGANDVAIEETERLATQQGLRAATADTLGDTAAAGAKRLPGAGGAGDALPPPGTQVAAKAWPPDAMFSAGEIIDEVRQAAGMTFARNVKGEAGLRGLFSDSQTWNRFVDAVGSNDDPAAVRQFIGNMVTKRTPQGMQTVEKITAEDVTRAAGAQQAVGVANDARTAANGLPRNVGTSQEARAFGDSLQRPGTTLAEATQAREIAKILKPFADRYPDAARGILGAANEALAAGHGLDQVLARAQTLTERTETPGRLGLLNNAKPDVQRSLTEQYMRAPAGGEDAVLQTTTHAPAGSAAATQAAARATPAPAAPGPAGAPRPVEIPRAVREATGPDVPAALNEALPPRAQERLAGLSEDVRAAIGRNNGWSDFYAMARANPRLGEQIAYELNRQGADAVPGTLRTADFLSRHPDLLASSSGNWARELLPQFISQQFRNGPLASELSGELTAVARSLTTTQRSQLYRDLLSPTAMRGVNATDYREAVNGFWGGLH